MTQLADIAHIVELSVAPVFLLAGIGALLNVGANRLGRIIDRARFLEAQLLAEPKGKQLAHIHDSLVRLNKRMLHAQRAIFLFSLAALLICVVVAILFIGAFIKLNVAMLVALMFIATMFSMIGGLVFFLMEISVATKSLRLRADLLEK